MVVSVRLGFYRAMLVGPWMRARAGHICFGAEDNARTDIIYER